MNVPGMEVTAAPTGRIPNRSASRQETRHSHTRFADGQDHLGVEKSSKRTTKNRKKRQFFDGTEKEKREKKKRKKKERGDDMLEVRSAKRRVRNNLFSYFLPLEKVELWIKKILVKSSKIVGSAPKIQFRKTNKKIDHRVSSWKNVF